jgi:hypothetical protein
MFLNSWLALLHFVTYNGISDLDPYGIVSTIRRKYISMGKGFLDGLAHAILQEP